MILDVFKMFRRKVNLVILGLDRAGKTTMINYITKGEPGVTHPTVGASLERLKVKNLTFEVWDLGGQKHLRKIWDEYVKNADAVIFMIDSADRERFPEAKREFWKIANILKPGTPLLILANKADLPNAASIFEIIEYFEIQKLQGVNWQVMWVSALNGFGLRDAFAWIYEQLTGKRLVKQMEISEVVVLDRSGRIILAYPKGSATELGGFVSIVENFVRESMKEIPLFVEMGEKKIIFVRRLGFTAAAIISKKSPESNVMSLLAEIIHILASGKDVTKVENILSGVMTY